MAKTITIFLKDGDADGIIKTSISNSSILCYKIPRDRLDAAKEIPHLSYTGVYFLFGNGKVYVGQAGYRKNGYAIFTRLSEHDKSPEKEFWTEAVVFTKTEDTLGSTEISYLEHMMLFSRCFRFFHELPLIFSHALEYTILKPIFEVAYGWEGQALATLGLRGDIARWNLAALFI